MVVHAISLVSVVVKANTAFFNVFYIYFFFMEIVIGLDLNKGETETGTTFHFHSLDETLT